MLRQALQDHPYNPQYIETVPTFGYRFIAPLEEIELQEKVEAKGRLGIIPFQVLRLRPGDEHLAQGITYTVISELSKFIEMTLPPQKSIDKFINKELDPIQIGHETNVDIVLTGIIINEKDAGRIRISAHLISVNTGNILWAGQFDETISDFIAFEDVLSTKIARELKNVINKVNLSLGQEIGKEIEICKRQDFVVPADVENLSYKYHQKQLHAFLVEKARERTPDKERQARLLNISRQTLYLWEKELGLK